MDIISFLQGKKAQKKAREQEKLIGQDSYKNGEKDIIDVYADADLRLKDIEGKVANNALNTKVSDLSEQTFINLNKHNLQVNALLQADGYKHKNMVFNDLVHGSSIDTKSSVNITHDTVGGKVKQTNPLIGSELHTNSEPVNKPNNLVVSGEFSENNKTTIEMDASYVESMANIELLKNNILRIAPRDKTGNAIVGGGNAQQIIAENNFRKVWHVSPKGSASGDGSAENPYSQLVQFHPMLQDGDGVYFMEGVHECEFVIHYAGYSHVAIEDNSKQVYFFGDNEKTILRVVGSRATLRDGAVFGMFNDKSVCSNFTVHYEPKASASTYSNSIFLNSSGFYKNLYIENTAPLTTQYMSVSYFNGTDYNYVYTPKIFNCIFKANGKFTSSHSGGIYEFRNCIHDFGKGYIPSSPARTSNNLERAITSADIDNENIPLDSFEKGYDQIKNEDGTVSHIGVLGGEVGWVSSYYPLHEKGSIITKVIDFNDNAPTIDSIQKNVIATKGFSKVYISTSNDGKSFGPFTDIDVIDKTKQIKRYAKFKIELFAGTDIVTVIKNDELFDYISVNDTQITTNGSVLKLKTRYTNVEYESRIEKENGFSISRKKMSKADFKKISKIESKGV